MKTKEEIFQAILKNKNTECHELEQGTAFAPSNIALCKYWGKRNQALNLPVTSSLSISLGNYGTTTKLKISNVNQHEIILNNKLVAQSSEFHQRIITFLNLIPMRSSHFRVDTTSNIPISAGFASSASGFAALVMALNDLFKWHLSPREMSILARLGSGSASRSIWQGFVEWHRGERKDGMDSYGEPISQTWPELCLGTHLINADIKNISSREAMQHTIETSPFYKEWPAVCSKDLENLKQAIADKNFDLLGQTAESNALAMHAMMLTAHPSILYSVPETLEAILNIWKLRQNGISLYFTQDAGPNLILIFLKEVTDVVKEYFPTLRIISPFEG